MSSNVSPVRDPSHGMWRLREDRSGPVRPHSWFRVLLLPDIYLIVSRVERRIFVRIVKIDIVRSKGSELSLPEDSASINIAGGQRVHPLK